jgi:peptidyl-prolyl cis-trans isomerase C
MRCARTNHDNGAEILMTRLVGSVFAASLAALAGACTQSSAPGANDATLGPGEVATVNGQRIPESIFRVYTPAAMRKNADDLTPDERKTVIHELAGVILMAEEAQKTGLLAERTIAAQLELARLQLTARAMATRYLEQNAPTESELQAVFDENLPRLAGQEFKARHILLETKEEADSVIQQLQQGKSFLDLANERAAGPTGPNGGDLGWFTTASMAQPVVDAVSAMKVGSYSTEPVKTEYGYHVLLLEDTRSQEPPTLDSLRQELTSAVQQKKLQDHVRTLVEAATVVEKP